VSQTEESGGVFLNDAPLFRLEVQVRQDEFPCRICRSPGPDTALRHIAKLTPSMDMVKPEVIYPSVIE